MSAIARVSSVVVVALALAGITSPAVAEEAPPGLVAGERYALSGDGVTGSVWVRLHWTAALRG